MDIQQYAKTQEGVEVLESAKPFAINNQIWQGFKKTPIKVHESQLTDDEMEKLVDVDGTLRNVWATRRRRLEERVSRKNGEFMERLTQLRTQRNEIVTSIKNQRELGIPASPADEHQLKEIDRRMERLTTFPQVAQLVVATKHADDVPVEEAVAVPIPTDEVSGVECPHCGKAAPAGHKTPKKWLRGHNMSCKSRPKKAN